MSHRVLRAAIKMLMTRSAGVMRRWGADSVATVGWLMSVTGKAVLSLRKYCEGVVMLAPSHQYSSTASALNDKSAFNKSNTFFWF